MVPICSIIWTAAEPKRASQHLTQKIDLTLILTLIKDYLSTDISLTEHNQSAQEEFCVILGCVFGRFNYFCNLATHS